VCVLRRDARPRRLVPAVRIGFAVCSEGFAAVLYRRTLEDGTLEGAVTRTPWSRDLAQVMAWGSVWAQRLDVPLDALQMSTAFLGDDHAHS
jgi:hypothetical protein